MKKSKKSTQTQSRVLGVDPGYGRIGFAIIEKVAGKETLIHSECFETSEKLPHFERLALVAERTKELLEQFGPNKVAVETLLFNKNVKTAIKVAEARGVVLAEIAKKNIALSEYNPNEIKLSITGYGRSDKKQIINMVSKMIKIEKQIKHDDEYDAIATALTCLQHLNYPQKRF